MHTGSDGSSPDRARTKPFGGGIRSRVALHEYTNGIQYVVRELEHGDPGFTTDDRRRACRYGVQERLQFELERLIIVPVKMLDVDRGALARFVKTAADHALAGLEIDGHISILLKNTQATHLVHRNPAGRQIGNAAVRKLNSRIGDIDIRGKNRHAGGTHLFHRSRIKGEHQIQVMYHEIKDDIDVRAPFPEGAQSVAFDERRPPYVRAHELHDGIEPLAVTDLQ